MEPLLEAPGPSPTPTLHLRAAHPAASVCLLGASWEVINGVISPLIWVISTVTLLITLLMLYYYP